MRQHARHAVELGARINGPGRGLWGAYDRRERRVSGRDRVVFTLVQSSLGPGSQDQCVLYTAPGRKHQRPGSVYRDTHAAPPARHTDFGTWAPLPTSRSEAPQFHRFFSDYCASSSPCNSFSSQATRHEKSFSPSYFPAFHPCISSHGIKKKIVTS